MRRATPAVGLGGRAGALQQSSTAKAQAESDLDRIAVGQRAVERGPEEILFFGGER